MPLSKARAHQLGVDLGDLGVPVDGHFEVDVRLAAERLEQFETASTPSPAHWLRGVGHALQLVEHRLDDHDLAVQEAGPDDVENAARRSRRRCRGPCRSRPPQAVGG